MPGFLLSLTFCVLAVLGISSAYLAGLTRFFGFSIVTLLDFRFTSNAMLSITLFIILSSIFFRMGMLGVQSGMAVAMASRIRTALDEWGVRSPRPPWLRSLAKIALSLVLILLTFSMMLLITRFFLDWQGALAFLLSAYFAGAAALLAVRVASRKSSASIRSILREYVRNPKRMLTNKTLIAALTTLVLLLSFQFGSTRFFSLMRAAPVCFVLNNGEIEAALIGETDFGYFYTTARLPAFSPSAAFTTQNLVGFVSRDELRLISGTCAPHKVSG